MGLPHRGGGTIGIPADWEGVIRDTCEQELAEWQEECVQQQRPQQPGALDNILAIYDLGDRASLDAPSASTAELSAMNRTAESVASLPDDRTVGLRPTIPDQDHWLRPWEGRWQRKVLLNQLLQHPQYNGLTGWVDLEQLECSAGARPQLLAVFVESLSRTLQVNSTNIFLVGPNLLTRPLDQGLVVIEARLAIRNGDKPVTARLVVDSGCQLEGVLSTEFIRKQGWSPGPTSLAVNTAAGHKVQGVQQIFANSHLAPGFTRQVAYGVLNLPGFDGLLGVGFLNQFKPFAIEVRSNTERVVKLTLPKNQQVITIPGLAWDGFAGESSRGDVLPADASPPVLSVQWEPPSAEDLANVVSAFHVCADPGSRVLNLLDDDGLLAEFQQGDSVPGLGGSEAERWDSLLGPDSADGLVFLTHSLTDRYQHAPAEVRDLLQKTLAKYQDSVFRECEYPPYPPARDVDFQINLNPGAQIPASPVHKLAPALVEKLRQMLKELLHNGLLVPSSSPFAAPLLMVKKPDGSYRLCIDYRKLNAVTVKDRYPLPNPSMIFDKLAGCKYFSKLDLRWGYWQIRMADADVEKTAFRSPLGSFAWKVMGMGLTNAAPTFQRLMDSIFRDLDFVSCYLDDIMIASKTATEHLQHIDIVLQRLQQHQLLAREAKCAFFMSEIKFLGYVFSAAGKAVDSTTVEAICQIPAPETVHQLQRWLGQVNYYSMFIPKYAEIIAPLTDLLKGTSASKKKKCLSRLVWGPLQQRAFETIRARLACPPILKLFDPSLASKVAADASGVAVGGVLMQQHDERWHPVAYYSRKLTPVEQRYTTRERECLAVKQCLVEWRHYLLGAPFSVQSDHESLKWLRTQGVSTLSDRLLRWVEYFSLFDFQHEYIPGEDNVFPDNLSRPATQVFVVSTESGTREWDLWTLATRLDSHQAISPLVDSMVAVVAGTQFQAPFLTAIREAQAADPDLAAIKEQLKQGEGRPPPERMLYQLYEDCLVVPEINGNMRLLVPTHELQLAICKHAHDEGGHQGVHRTIQAITNFFYWPNMQRMIRSYVTSCTVCQTAKSGNRLPAGIAEPVSLMVEPGAHWTIDFVELPESANGFRRLLIFTDRLSKVTVLVPMKSASASDVAAAFVEHVFCWFGMPQSFFSDKGPEFRAAVFHEICQLLGTTVKHSTPHTPHSHGDVERQNRIVNDILRTLSQEQFPDLLARWDEHIKLIQFVLNTSVVHRHGMSPLFFFFGRHPRIPLTSNLPAQSLDPMALEFVQSFQTRLQQALDMGREGQVRMVAAMDKERDPNLQYRVGDWALLAWTETPVPGEAHFQGKWTGPFRILASTTSTVTLELPEHWQLSSNTFHVNKVRPFIIREGAADPPPRPPRFRNRPPGDVGTIQRISHHRRVGRRQADGKRATLQYFVHWQGLPQAYGEWLSERELAPLPGAAAHIRTYQQAFKLTDL